MPQPTFVEVAERVTGTILDAGCGTGENALFFAEKGHPVLGIDFLEGPIREARRKAQERGLDAEFVQKDALTLTDLDRKFDAVIDSGLFHVFSDEDRARYVAGLAHVTWPGGRLQSPGKAIPEGLIRGLEWAHASPSNAQIDYIENLCYLRYHDRWPKR